MKSPNGFVFLWCLIFVFCGVLLLLFVVFYFCFLWCFAFAFCGVLFHQQGNTDELHISLTTIIIHRKNITEKLGIKSVSGLTIYAVMRGYVEADFI